MKKSSIAVMGLFLLVYIAPLGVRPIIIPDESRYAEIPREMLVSGDWVVPCLNGLRYFEKPALGYWINAGSMMLFGENAFAVRFPSAVAAGITALILFLLVRRFGDGYSAGILSSALLLTCVEVFAVGTSGVLDSVLSLFVTGAMVSFFLAYMEDKPGRKTWFLVLLGGLCGLAFLTKGFIAFALPVVAVGPFLIWERRWKELLRITWVPIVVAVMVALPWAIMIHLREPDFWHYFFWTEHIRRFFADNSQHINPFWYFIPGVIAGALPWTVLLPAVLQGLKGIRLKAPLVRFAICWFLFPFLFFSASKGKLLTYILPCFPPLAILMTIGVQSYVKRGGRRAFTIGALLLALMTTILAITLLVVQVADFEGFRPYTQTWKWVLALAGFLSWTLFLLFSVRESKYPKKIMLFGLAPILFMFSANFIMPDLIMEHKAPGEFLIHHSNRVRPDTILVSGQDPVRAVCWFYKRSDVYLLEAGGELSYGLHFEDSRHRMLNLDQFREVVLKNRGTGRVTLVAKARKYKNWKQSLPEPVFEDCNGNGGFVFVQF